MRRSSSKSSASGFDIPFGERGVGLSGGQRQRPGDAKALSEREDDPILNAAHQRARHPDRETLESKRLWLGYNVLMIAHCLSTVHNATQLLGLGPDANRLNASLKTSFATVQVFASSADHHKSDN